MPVTQEQLVGIIIVAVIDLPLIVISIVLMMGRGSDFIAGINTMSHREKEKYDLPALCRSVGRFTLIAGLLMRPWFSAAFVRRYSSPIPL